MKVNEYRLMDECVGEGIEEGWYIAHTKHVTPTPEEIQKEIHDAVMKEISEIFYFEAPDEYL